MTVPKADLVYFWILKDQ